jgi:hypothetical protein
MIYALPLAAWTLAAAVIGFLLGAMIRRADEDSIHFGADGQ